MSSDQIILWTAVILIALACDLMLHRWLRQTWQARGVNVLVERAERAAAATASMLDRAFGWIASAGRWFRPERWRRLWLSARSRVPSAPPASAASSDASSPVPMPAVAAITASSDEAGHERPEVTLVPVVSQPEAASTAGPHSPRVARVQLSVELPEGTAVRVTLESLPGSGVSIEQQPARPTRAAPALPRPRLSVPIADWGQRLGDGWQRLRAWAQARAISLDVTLFGLSLGLYVLTRLIGITHYPIYFFSDEAVQTVQAATLVQTGFKNHLGEFFPTYFQNSSFWNLSVSVYAQVIPYLLFGQSVLVTRATSALLTTLGAVAVGLTLKRVFNLRFWWAAALLLSISPAWFLHSRTAFETVEMVALYAVFLYCYGMYRYHSPRYLYLAILTGALAYYAYSPGQAVMLMTGGLLFLSDLGYHLRPENRGVLRRGIVVLAIAALPLLRFQLAHSEAAYNQLRERGSYLVDPNLTLEEKLNHTVSEYLYGLSPSYWYLPNGRELSRHTMKNYGNLPLATLPLAALGLFTVVRNFRSSAHRMVLIALLASPVGGALAEIGITRVMMFIIPATLLAGLGLALLLGLLADRWRGAQPLLSLATFAVLAGTNIYMLRDALVNGPLWHRDYTLGGMQYGAQQLFEEAAPRYLADPNTRLAISPSWANGTEYLLQFFVPEELRERVQLWNVDYYLAERRLLDANTVVVLPFYEYAQALASPKFQNLQVLEILPYPDGTPGFYFTKFAYSDQADALFAAERAERAKPVEAQVEIDGQLVTIRFSALGAGRINDALDRDTYTVLRGSEANPIVFDFTFPAPRSMTGLQLTVGSMGDFSVTARLYPPDQAAPVEYAQRFTGLPDDPTVSLAFAGGPPLVSRLQLNILNYQSGDSAQIHVREIIFEK